MKKPGGRPIIRASIDKFHNSRGERYKRGKNSPKGYYLNSFNYPALVRELLEPLGSDGNLSYRTGAFDFRTDSIIHQEQNVAPANAYCFLTEFFCLDLN